VYELFVYSFDLRKYLLYPGDRIMSRITTRQPKGLRPLFFTEMWERFGFYMVQTLLVLFMTHSLDFPDHEAYLLYGVFGSMIYLTPVIGGFVADRWIGFRNAVLLGGVLLTIGYALMAVPDERIFFLGMEIVIIGNGFFKPNVSTLLGDLYETDDPRRDGGFTIFYMGINIGSIIPPIISGFIVVHYGWGWGFGISSLGMIAALIVFVLGYRYYEKAGLIPSRSPLHRAEIASFGFILGAGLLAALVLLHFLFMYPAEGSLVVGISSVSVIIAILFILAKEAPGQRRKLIACLILILLSMGFWSVYNQVYSSLMLFADRNMSKGFLGLTIDPEFTQFFNPFFILLLSPFLGRLWIHLYKRKLSPSTPLKFSVGLLSVSIGMLALASGSHVFYDAAAQASPWWIVLCYFFLTVGELLISPIGLAMITRLAPPHLCGMMMGVWFLAISAGFAVGGGLATFSDIPKLATPHEALQIYSHAFLIFGIIAFALAIIGFIITPFVRKLIGERH